MRTLRLKPACVALLAVASCQADSAPKLNAMQYLRAEQIYGKAIAGCCLRREGARKLHLEIEQRVAAGETDQAILADVSKRFGGQARFDQTPADRPGTQDSTLLGASALLATGIAAWALLRKHTSRPHPPSDKPHPWQN